MSLGISKVAINPVNAALAACRRHFVAVAAFSAVANILYLTPSIYMMQVYDRVIPTGGLATLAAISLVALFAVAVQSGLEWLRARLLVRAGATFDAELAGPTLVTIMARPDLSRLERAEAMRHFDTVRQGISSAALTALFDAPWAPIYIVVAWLLHPALGALAFGSALALLALAWSNERATGEPLRIAADAAGEASMKQGQTVAYAAEVRALGLGTALAVRQLAERAEVGRLQGKANLAGGNHSSIIRFLRMVLQSAALGVGAWLVVKGSVSAGAMLAASLLLSRALAPIEQIVGAWKTILYVRQSHAKLCQLLDGSGRRDHTRLPAPTGAIQVQGLAVVTPQNDRLVLADINFAVSAGEIIGVVGLSGTGKTSLLRALAGAVLPTRGHIRFDGASSADWDPEQLARHIGYLPQNFVLFPGTVKENISRFRGDLGDDPEMIDEQTIAAARAIGAHEMILQMPQGYDTPIGSGGIGLSSGQTQRIAIARALYGSPRLLVLDEPTAHLDANAQHAFMKTLSQLRGTGTTVIYATHSGDILASADKLLLLANGRIERFAPLAEVASAVDRPVSHSPRKVS